MTRWNKETFIGKETPKGVVVKRMLSGQCLNTYFVGNGTVKEMVAGAFLPVSEDVARSVGFMASRMGSR